MNKLEKESIFKLKCAGCQFVTKAALWKKVLEEIEIMQKNHGNIETYKDVCKRQIAENENKFREFINGLNPESKKQCLEKLKNTNPDAIEILKQNLPTAADS